MLIRNTRCNENEIEYFAFFCKQIDSTENGCHLKLFN